jgi:hypothetical protein
MIEKSDSKWLPLATAPILGQAPSHPLNEPRRRTPAFLKTEEILHWATCLTIIVPVMSSLCQMSYLENGFSGQTEC